MIVASRVSVIIFLVALFSLLGGGLEKFADDPGVGWHLESGAWMIEQGRIPDTDPFLFNSSSRSWVSDQWLSDIVLAQLLDWGGFPLVYAVLLSIFLITFFVVLSGALVRCGAPCLSSLLAALFAFKLAQVHLLLRPVVFGIFCFSVLFALLLPIYRIQMNREGLTRNLRALFFALPVLFVLWANLHPSFMLGLIFISLLAGGFLLCWFLDPHAAKSPEVLVASGGLSMVLVLSFLATLINPYGLGLHRSILALGSSTFFMNYHQEWLSPDFSQPEGQFFEVMLFGALIALIFRQKVVRVSLIDVLLLFVFTHLSLDAVRFFPFWGMVISPYFSRFFGFFEVLKPLPVFRLLFPAIESLEQKQKKRFPSSGFVVSILIALIGYTAVRQALPFYHGSYGPRTEAYSYEALGALLAIVPTGSTAVLAADAGYGGFITWMGEGRVRALIDDRNTLLGEDFYRSFDRALEEPEKGIELFRSLGADYLLLRKDNRQAQTLSLGGRVSVVFEDSLVYLFSLKQAREEGKPEAS